MADIELRKRKLTVQVDTIVFEGVSNPGLRITCKATKTLKPEPNKCELVIYNLNPAHRASLTKIKRPTVSVSAGYVPPGAFNNPTPVVTQIFLGQAYHVKHEQRGGDIVTIVSTNDSGDKQQKAHVYQSFGPGTKVGNVLQALAKELNVKPGNLKEVARKLNAGKAADMFAEGCIIEGHAPLFITELCRSAGIEWSIQDGTLQLLDTGKALAARAIVLDPSLLIGTPSVSSKNVVEFTTFIQGDTLPGRQVQIKHPFANVTARLEKCEYILDTYADDWYVNGEAQGPKVTK
jgi:hypothetical protein